MFWWNREFRRLRRLWTSERNKWFLVEVKRKLESGYITGYVIRSDDGDLLKIESSDLKDYVVDQMKKAGVRVYSSEEFDKKTS